MKAAIPDHNRSNKPLLLADLQAHVLKTFEKTYKRPPACIVAAPGRVNIIGEHVDYNDGLVLPAAIDRWISAAVSPRDDTQIIIYDVGLGNRVVFQINTIAPQNDRNWINYVQGIIAGFIQRGYPIRGFEMAFSSNIPIGAGLSSSAALEATIALAVCYLQNISIPRLELAKLCQQAEHNYAGVPCGLMDQAAVLLSRENQLLMLDCQSNSVGFCPWDNPDWKIMIINSGVAHELASGEYRERRMCCHQAAQILGIPSLRQIEPMALERELRNPRLTDDMKRCIRHVVTENVRTREVMTALSNGYFTRVGQLLQAGHESLRADYRVSCEELDFIAQTVNALDGVAGCRMTGGGFGGSAVAVVQTNAAEKVQREIETAYRIKFARRLGIFLTGPVSAARAWAA